MRYSMFKRDGWFPHNPHRPMSAIQQLTGFHPETFGALITQATSGKLKISRKEAATLANVALKLKGTTMAARCRWALIATASGPFGHRQNLEACQKASTARLIRWASGNATEV